MTNSDIFKNTVFDHASPLPMLMCSVLAGILFATLIDAFSLTERFFGKNKIIRFLTDLLAVIFSYLFLFVCAYNFNNGIIRWYCIVALLIAVKVHRSAVSRQLLKILNFLADITQKLFSFLLSVVLYPLRKIYSALVKSYRFAAQKIAVAKRNAFYKKEKHKISSRANNGFGLAPILKEEKEWNRTEKTKRVKKSASRRRLRFF